MVLHSSDTAFTGSHPVSGSLREMKALALESGLAHEYLPRYLSGLVWPERAVSYVLLSDRFRVSEE